MTEAAKERKRGQERESERNGVREKTKTLITHRTSIDHQFPYYVHT